MATFEPTRCSQTIGRFLQRGAERAFQEGFPFRFCKQYLSLSRRYDKLTVHLRKYTLHELNDQLRPSSARLAGRDALMEPQSACIRVPLSKEDSHDNEASRKSRPVRTVDFAGHPRSSRLLCRHPVVETAE